MRCLPGFKKYLIAAFGILAVGLILYRFAGASVGADELSGWIVEMYDDASGNQSEFFTISNEEEDKLVVVDGGWSENADQLREVIQEKGGTVDCWIVTHYHEDHCGAFNQVYADPQGIEINDIYATPLDRETFEDVMYSWDNPETFDQFMSQTEGDERVHYVTRGEELSVGSLHIRFFNTYDEIVTDENYGNRRDIPNNDALVFKAWTDTAAEAEAETAALSETEGSSAAGKSAAVYNSILFGSDCYSEGIWNYMEETFGEELKSKYIQAVHHGNSEMPNRFYEYMDPEVILFNANEWLMLSEDHKAKDLKAWCDERGITTYDCRDLPLRFSLS